MKDVHSTSWCAALELAKSEHRKMGKGTLKDQNPNPDYGFSKVEDRDS